jgi:hypothetical protein
MSLRLTQICRQWFRTGRNVNQWVPLDVESDLLTAARSLRLARGVPLRLFLSLDETEDDAIPETMRLVNEHFYHVAQLHIRSPPDLLGYALEYLGDTDGPLLQRLTIETVAPDGSSYQHASRWGISGDLLHRNGHDFDRLRHLVFIVFAPNIRDMVWSFLVSMELNRLCPPWPLEDYLEVIDRSPSLASLKIVGTMHPGNLSRPPLPSLSLHADCLRSLHLSDCSSRDVNAFIGRVFLPKLDDMSIAPSESPHKETFVGMLGVGGDAPRTISSFVNVRSIEVGTQVHRGMNVAVLSCQLFRDEGVYTISLPKSHPLIFSDVVRLFQNLELFTVSNMTDALDLSTIGYSRTVRTLRIQGPQDRLSHYPKHRAGRCFPICRVELIPIPLSPPIPLPPPQHYNLSIPLPPLQYHQIPNPPPPQQHHKLSLSVKIKSLYKRFRGWTRLGLNSPATRI